MNNGALRRNTLYTNPTILISVWALACGMDPDSIPNAQVDGEENEYPRLPDLDAAITQEMASSHIPGLSACLIKGEETIWCNGYGYADIEAKRQVNRSTPFILASISKTFVAEAAMHLNENGGLPLDEPISSILPFSVVHPNDDQSISTRMLLSHTAGIKDNWSVLDSVMVEGDSQIALGDFLEGYLVEGGQRYSSRRNFIRAGVQEKSVYSNVGVALAAYVVEVAAGVPFDEYCEQYIFEPLQLQDTSWHLSGLDENTLAVPYERRFGGWQPYAHYGYPDYPDVNLRTGAEQLARFLSMHANDGELQGIRIVSQESVAEMNTAHYPGLDPQQGLVWYRWNMGGEAHLGHNGGDYGASTEMGVREDGLGFVLLMNIETGDDVLANIAEAMLEAASDL
jgi:CubicO group peptidase (beta-lactamase class C family)